MMNSLSNYITNYKIDYCSYLYFDLLNPQYQFTGTTLRCLITVVSINRGVIVIVVGIGHDDTSSNPGLIAFHIALIPLGKV